MEVNGINEEKIDKLVIDLYSYSDRVKEILSEVELTMSKIKEIYVSEYAKELESLMPLYKQKFNIINQNILSYSDDFIHVKELYKKREQNMADIMKKAINEKEEIYGN